ncbi:hypothetical protein NDU88_005473 [Pleurodeles waltl]|uniref:Uncharacterized protein n=1 Tax=Pleurodeles waltl TaxID=8319 RepID=A0AAV7RNY2_PLEWA|nr:hypothetical protein NDU88_005473 [Pleurodeles waltl]
MLVLRCWSGRVGPGTRGDQRALAKSTLSPPGGTPPTQPQQRPRNGRERPWEMGTGGKRQIQDQKPEWSGAGRNKQGTNHATATLTPCHSVTPSFRPGFHCFNSAFGSPH